MKLIYISLLLSFWGRCASGQSISALDQKHGFKDFRIDDPKSKWMSQISLYKIVEKSTSIYDYNGPCCREAFGLKLDQVSLAFDQNNKLVSIFLQVDKNQEAIQVKKLFDTVEEAFGKPTYQQSNDDTGNILRQWAGKQTLLDVSAAYKGADLGGWQIKMLVSSKDTNKSKDF